MRSARPASGETYMFAALRPARRSRPKRALTRSPLRQEVLDVSGNVGLLPALYERG